VFRTRVVWGKMHEFEQIDKVLTWRKEPLTFLKELFPHIYSYEFAPFHKEIFSTLKTHKRVAIAAPRGHGKSKIISFGWVMWNLLCNIDSHFIIIISNNYANACDYLRPIKEEIEHNRLLREVFGELKSDKWSENEAEFTHRKKIIVGGNELKIRGKTYLEHRPDLIVIDDAEDDELVRSEQRRENFEKWLLYSLTPAMTLTNKDQIVLIGTILHRASQLSKLMEGEGKYREWYSKKYEARNREGTKALWEDKITLEWLKREEEKDPYRFAQEFMNNPVPYEHALFKSEYFDNYDEPPKNLIINFTVDLACTDKSYSDYTVILPVGIDEYGDMWVLPYTRGKYIDPDKIIDLMFSAMNICKGGWKFGKFGVEKNAFQRFLIKNFQKERKKRNLHFPIYEIQAKGDKTQRIAQLQPLFAAGDIHIRNNMLDLKQELLDFPRAQHDDISDALCMHMEFLNRKPFIKLPPDYKWKITPQMQFNKEMNKRNRFYKPKVKNIAVGV
jgi:predicted phage terminase large subunit-like protein